MNSFNIVIFIAIYLFARLGIRLLMRHIDMKNKERNNNNNNN